MLLLYTGLDIDKHTIIEVACIVSDGDLHTQIEVGDWIQLGIYCSYAAPSHHDPVLAAINPPSSCSCSPPALLSGPVCPSQAIR